MEMHHHNHFSAVETIVHLRTERDTPTLSNSIFLCDRFGNSALHMAVIHDLPDMYDYVLSLAERAECPSTTEFQNWRNSEGLTPLSLAAAMGKVRMFQHVLSCVSLKMWTYGPVASYLVPFKGLVQAQQESGRGGTENGLGGTENPHNEIVAIRCICAGRHVRLTKCLPFEVSPFTANLQHPR